MSQPTPDIIDELAHTRVEDCYQCGKCTAGCPMADVMDVMPNQILRFAQTGGIAAATTSRAIWLCVSCQTCTERCPKNVDPAGVMDAMRQLSLRRGDASDSVQRTIVFQKAFLDNIKRNGRLRELEFAWRAVKHVKSNAIVFAKGGATVGIGAIVLLLARRQPPATKHTNAQPVPGSAFDISN